MTDVCVWRVFTGQTAGCDVHYIVVAKNKDQAINIALALLCRGMALTGRQLQDQKAKMWADRLCEAVDGAYDPESFTG